MIGSVLAAVRDRDADGVLAAILVVVGFLLLLVAAFRAYQRDGVGAAIAGVVGLLLLVFFWDNADL